MLKDPGLGLAKKAVDQMRLWKMKPAPGPDGKPADCRIQIVVSFHLSGLPHHVSAPTAEEYPIPISVAQEAKLAIGYRGVVLGQNVYVNGTKIVDQAVAHAICNVPEPDSKSPQLNEEFFRQPGGTVCSVYPDKDGHVARIVIEARMSILRAIDMLTREYGPPKPGLYPIEGGKTNGTLWSWTVRDEHLANIHSPKISVEPKVRTNQKNDEYDSYVEIVYWH